MLMVYLNAELEVSEGLHRYTTRVLIIVRELYNSNNVY